MTPDETFSTIVRLVPHWYRAEHGPHQYHETVTGYEFGFCSLRNLTPDLYDLWNDIEHDLNKWIAQASEGTPSFTECLQESIVIRWLERKK